MAAEALGERKADAEVIDFGCGTGLCGKRLAEHKVTKVVGLDASAGMIEQAKSKGIYSDLREMFLGQPDKFPEEFHNRFDALTASGILAEGHCPNEVMDEMVLALKVGGFACFSTRIEYLEKYKFSEKMKELEEAGKWKLIKTEDFLRYDKLEEVIGRFSKTEVRGFVYQKL